MKSESLSVLMVDDNLADVETFRRYLNDPVMPWDVTFESILKPEEALIRVPEGNFDVLIVDYRFPVGDGLKLTSLLSDEGNEAPVIMVTGQGNEKVAAEAFKYDIDDYLLKEETDAETLKKSIENVLAEKPEPSP